MAAENTASSCFRGAGRNAGCFNEAAAHGRGKRPSTSSTLPRDVRFNEAAAHGRGKQEAV